jgi:WD40 repeat protein
MLEHRRRFSPLGILCWRPNVGVPELSTHASMPLIYGCRLSTVLSPKACLSRIATSCKGCLAVTNIHGDFDLYDLRTHLPVAGNITNVEENSACSGAVAFAHNGKSLVGGTNSGIILLWDIENCVNFQSLRHGALPIYIISGATTESPCPTGSARVSAVSVSCPACMALVLITWLGPL